MIGLLLPLWLNLDGGAAPPVHIDAPGERRFAPQPSLRAFAVESDEREFSVAPHGREFSA